MPSERKHQHLLSGPVEGAGRHVFLAISGSMLSVRPWKSLKAPGKVRLISFRQTGARSGVFRGVPVYRMEYEAHAVAVDELMVDNPPGSPTVLCRQGRCLTERGVLTFEWTEQGWRGEDGQFYGDRREPFLQARADVL